MKNLMDNKDNNKNDDEPLWCSKRIWWMESKKRDENFINKLKRYGKFGKTNSRWS